MASSTSSFRISDELRQQLESASRILKKRKNWILNHALEEYLQKISRASIAAEARRQSMLASRRETVDERFWQRHADTEEWK